MFKRLGELEGDLLIFGGIYANFPALEAFKAESERLGIAAGNIICTGDILGCGGEPDKCIQFLKRWGVHAIGGNIEFLLNAESEDERVEDKNEGKHLFDEWIPFLQQKLNKTSRAFIKDLPEFITFSYDGRKHVVMHGSFFNTSEYIFKSTPWEVKQKSFDASGAEVVLAGHCGIPFAQSKSQKNWINAGSIGMPANEGGSKTWYLHINNKQLSFKQLEYDFKKAQMSILKAGLPQSFAESLETGLWPASDFLPKEEKALEGKPILL